MKFTKMHGIGNDYIYVNAMEEKIEDIAKTARFVSDRHFGIGSDGLVLIMASEKADFRMRMFNSDGSEAEMCGNAIRCVGKYVYDNQLTCKENITIETLAGIKILDLNVKDGKVITVRVNMGEPILEPSKIVVDIDGDMCVDQTILVDGNEYKFTAVSMGNPHCITYRDGIDNMEIEKIGPKFEVHSLFPNKTNTEFVEVVDSKTLKMRVWERGAGETLACGTGACAVLVSSVLNKLCDRSATVKLLGGDLEITWDEETNCVFMEGSATKVFDGEIELD